MQVKPDRYVNVSRGMPAACSAAFGFLEVPCILLAWPVGMDALDTSLPKAIASDYSFAVRYLCIT
jgi:hypothetical protein